MRGGSERGTHQRSSSPLTRRTSCRASRRRCGGTCPSPRRPSRCACLPPGCTSACPPPASGWHTGASGRSVSTGGQRWGQGGSNRVSVPGDRWRSATNRSGALGRGAVTLPRPRRGGSRALPRKMGLNWFMPLLANSSVGSSRGTTGLLCTISCSRPAWGRERAPKARVSRGGTPVAHTRRERARLGAEVLQEGGAHSVRRPLLLHAPSGGRPVSGPGRQPAAQGGRQGAPG